MIPLNVIGLDQSHEEHHKQARSLLTSAQRRADHKDFGIKQRSQVSSDI